MAIYTDEAQSPIRGGPVFQGLFNELRARGADIKGIIGHWYDGDKPSTNLISFNKAILGGMSPEQAAEQKAFTGAMARKNGDGHATIDDAHSPRNADGTFQEAHVYYDP